jgi:hypothetical protein
LVNDADEEIRERAASVVFETSYERAKAERILGFIRMKPEAMLREFFRAAL